MPPSVSNQPPVARPGPRQPAPRPVSSPARSRTPRWAWLIPAALAGFLLLACAATTLIVAVSYAGGILPGVYVAGVRLGGLDEEAAAGRLQAQWGEITLLAGEREVTVTPESVGLLIDAERTAAAAFAVGRGRGDALQAIIGRVDLPPVVTVDTEVATQGLLVLRADLESEALNAGFEVVDGDVRSTAARSGHALDIQASIRRMLDDPVALADGRLALVTTDVPPTVADSSPLVAQARALLRGPFNMRVWDPVTDDSVTWSAPPDLWGSWLSVQPDADSPAGLRLALLPGPVQDFVESQARSYLDASRTIDSDQTVAALSTALAVGDLSQAVVQVHHHQRQHVVQPGESITSIAWDYGIPYPYIQAANDNAQSLSPGQTIIIPPADTFLELPAVPNKRIVVSISQQRTWAYQDGQLIWEWAASTGIDSSPTWPGVYQVLSHEMNAYAGNWDLYMPYFIGVYRPIPGSDFTNGFHGYPTRTGGQLLWRGNLGSKVTYGCIMLDDDSVRQLYEWAETGVIVEIQA